MINDKETYMMRKQLFVLSLMLMAVMAVSAQKRFKTYAVGFYNQENLFDTIHDEGKKDADFLPDGKYHWDSNKYNNKLKNMAQALSDMGTTGLPDQGCAVIGLAEVENARVLNDLIRQPQLKARGYKYVHIEGPDPRGIDCAMLYNPRYFQLEDSLYVFYIYPEAGPGDWLGFKQDSLTHEITLLPLYGDMEHKTRGFLVGIGTMAGEKMAVIVNHWPSRGAESWARENAARQVKRLTEALQLRYPGIKVIIMGDLNDDPDNKSMAKVMGCKYASKDVKNDGDIFNPWKYMLRTIGQGTLLYDGKWNLFDQIIMTGNLVDPKTPLSKTKPKMSQLDLSRGLTYYFNEVFLRDYMVTQSGRYKGSPLRTTASGVWQDGFSDHFPTCIYLVKELQ